MADSMAAQREVTMAVPTAVKLVEQKAASMVVAKAVSSVAHWAG
jgi:hypothetical protein